MTTTRSMSTKGYIIDCDTLPRGFLDALERRNLASIASRTTEGCYVEPMGSLAHVLQAIESMGLTVYSVRRSGMRQQVSVVRGTPEARERLRDRRCAEWLPTIA